MEETETKRCPYCGEEILAVAKKCKYCGEWLNDRSTEQTIESKKVKCPYCGEEINAEAKKCCHCGEWLTANTESMAADIPEIQKTTPVSTSSALIAERLESAIKTYVASHAKKYKTIFLVDHNLTDKIIDQHKKYAPIGSDEKVLLAVNQIFLSPFSGMGLLITDRFLYYRLANSKFFLLPLLTLFKKKLKGIIPLSEIKTIVMGDEITDFNGRYFGNRLLINGEVRGLLPVAAFNRDGAAEELNRLFKVFES